MTDQALPALETKEERDRRLARVRQQRKRQADAAAAVRGEAQPIAFEFDAYRGTHADLALICERGGFEEQAEAITLILHNVAELARRDCHAFAEFIRIPSRHEVLQ
jgi:hypothetical protein